MDTVLRDSVGNKKDVLLRSFLMLCSEKGIEKVKVDKDTWLLAVEDAFHTVNELNAEAGEVVSTAEEEKVERGASSKLAERYRQHISDACHVLLDSSLSEKQKKSLLAKKLAEAYACAAVHLYLILPRTLTPDLVASAPDMVGVLDFCS